MLCSGHAYDDENSMKQMEIVQTDHDMIQHFLLLLQQEIDRTNTIFNVNDIVISVGSTPSARHHPSVLANGTILANTIEVHPGNYVFYDRQQLWTNAVLSNHHHDIVDHQKNASSDLSKRGDDDSMESYLSGRVLSRVIGHYEDRKSMLLDAGSLALSKDSTNQGYFCSIANHPDLICTKLSQEVCIVQAKDENQPFPYEDFPLGKLVTLLPNHSCLAAACFDKYYVINDPNSLFLPNEKIIDEWIPAKFFAI
jgi:D-serine ammonia-lyase